MSTDSNTISAQDTVQVESPDTGSSWMSLVPMVLVFLVFYFLLIRPQEKKRRRQQELVAGVKKGEEVLLSSGIFGKVIDINDSDNTAIVRISNDSEVKILKTAITDITSRKEKENPGKNKENPKPIRKKIAKIPKSKAKTEFRRINSPGGEAKTEFKRTTRD